MKNPRRESAIIARTKLACAVRLIEEARTELCHADLPSGHPVIGNVTDLHITAQRSCILLDQTIKRIP